MKTVEFGSYVEHGRDKQKLVVQWRKLSALSEEFANKMASLAQLGIESFKDVEMDFLTDYPKAMEEDKNLSNFKGLKEVDLENSINAKLHQIFQTRPTDLSDEMRLFMADVFYYFVTIKDQSSDKILGFVTFMTGGPISKDEYKITVLAIDKGVRRAGLAGILVGSLEKIGVRPKKLFVCTRPSNSVAIRAYKKWGFVEDQDANENAPPHFIKGHWVHLARFE